MTSVSGSWFHSLSGFWLLVICFCFLPCLVIFRFRKPHVEYRRHFAMTSSISWAVGCWWLWPNERTSLKECSPFLVSLILPIALGFSWRAEGFHQGPFPDSLPGPFTTKRRKFWLYFSDVFMIQFLAFCPKIGGFSKYLRGRPVGI